MKKNMGNADRIIRTLVTAIIATLLLTGQIDGLVATVLGTMAVVLLGTSLLGFCPLYKPLRISTRKESSSQAR